MGDDDYFEILMNEMEEPDMQVFVPYTNLQQSATCLDPSRLGNQIYREAKTIITGGWHNHPAARAWYFAKEALAKYCLYGLVELYVERRDISKESFDTHYQFYAAYLTRPGLYKKEGCNPNNPLTAKVLLPVWWGQENIHASHRAALLYKDYQWYKQYQWKEQPAVPLEGKLPYIWPY